MLREVESHGDYDHAEKEKKERVYSKLAEG